MTYYLLSHKTHFYDNTCHLNKPITYTKLHLKYGYDLITILRHKIKYKPLPNYIQKTHQALSHLVCFCWSIITL